MTTKESLAARGLTTAVLVDDAYDSIPKAEDLALDDEAWTTFFADVGEDVRQLRAAFPDYDKTDARELQRSDAFVAAVWGLKGAVRDELFGQLFDAYEGSVKADRDFLKGLEDALDPLGVACVKAGRDLPAKAFEASIIFIDLYLGAAQEDPDIERALERLKQLMDGRQANPPLVILMSRSPLLADKKGNFRDKGALIGAMFRVCTKDQLREVLFVERLLERLARHHEDALRLVKFVQAWQSGLSAATDRFLKGIRRLDLSDYAQVRQVLLNFEGQPLGSYLLDVFDRVLQHEIEGDEGTIDAAGDLNKIRADDYPPHIAESTDLQSLAYSVIWQHPMRLKVKTTEADVPVGLGDVLVRRDFLEGGAASGNDADVFVILTSACDLVRPTKTTRALMLAGTLKPLQPQEWVYGQKARTPIIIMPAPDQRRMTVAWDLTDIRMVPLPDVVTLVGAGGQYRVALRMRESYALELQQQVVAGLGRVGVLAHIPANFLVDVSAYHAGTDGTPVEIDLPKARRHGGICYVGRGETSKERSRLKLTEDVIDELVDALGKLDENKVASGARETLKRAKESTRLRVSLETGIEVPIVTRRDYVELKVPSNDDPAVNAIVGLIARNPTSLELSGKVKQAALVLVLRDRQDENRGLEAAPAEGAGPQAPAVE